MLLILHVPLPTKVLSSCLVKRVKVLIIVSGLGLPSRAVKPGHRVLLLQVLVVLAPRVRLVASGLIIGELTQLTPVRFPVLRKIVVVTH